MSTNDQSSKPIKDMAGYIAKNTRRTNDKQPQWRGKVRIGGKEYLLSLWEKDSELMSLSVTDPETMPARTPPSSSPQGGSSNNSNNAASSDGDPFGDLFGSLPGG